ncbi:hypothetical protein EV182_003569, partial [Spiromyces aspiralis]
MRHVIRDNEEINALFRWMRLHGATIDPFIVVGMSPVSGRGIYVPAQQQQSGGSCAHLLEVPLNLVITRDRVERYAKDQCPPLCRCLDELWQVAEPGSCERDVLVAFLVSERIMAQLQPSPASPLPPGKLDWRPYINSLPSKLDSPVFYNQAELELIEGMLLWEITMSKLAALERRFEAGLRVLFRTLATDLAADLDAGDGPNITDSEMFELYKWAEFIVLSRSFSLRSQQHGVSDAPDVLDSSGSGLEGANDLALVPLVDFLNHSTKPSAIWAVGDAGHFCVSRIDQAEERQQEQDLDEYHEICLSYGNDKSNLEMMYLHGFSIERNPASSWPIHLVASHDRDVTLATAVKGGWLRSMGFGLRVNLALLGMSDARERPKVAEVFDIDELFSAFIMRYVSLGGSGSSGGGGGGGGGGHGFEFRDNKAAASGYDL